jgi:peptidoglycan/xylan/chitin deacetylase (PgdA/CDA1 family)
MKPSASISIDMDTLASIYKGQGCTRTGGYTYIEFRSGVENMLDFFERLGIHTTLFMVGSDFLYEKNHNAIKAITRSGHEIANHSMRHPQGFRWLSRAEKERELAEMNAICKAVSGQTPIGFRSPGWNVDDATIPILTKLGFRYESSVFPTSFMPLLKLSHWLSMSKQPKEARTTMGQIDYMFAPLRPYHVDDHALGKKGDNPLIEFPLSVSPLLRIPFFATLLLMSGIGLYKTLYRRIRAAGLPIHFQMHLSDFIDYSLPELEGQMPGTNQGTYIPQALHTPLAEKTAIFTEMVEMMAADYSFITLKEWADQIEGAV